KFTPQNGRVEVQIIFDKTNLDWHKITIKLEDSGIGIAPERLPYIFDRFYQVDDSNQRLYEGTGIGLALVKELVAVLKGEITVKSELNNGTTFTLTLFYEPLEILSNTGQLPSLNTLAEEVNLEINPFENDPNTPLMLIVEDNQDLRLYMASIFEAEYKLILAKDGQEGLEKAIEFVPDIVISDLMMPKLDGLDLCASLKNDERISHIPVIMLTAKATMADKLKGLKQGADDYVSKPFHKEELVLRAANLIQQRQLLQEKYSTKIAAILPKTEPEKEPTLEDLFIEKAQKVINNYLGESTFDVEIFANEMNLSPVQLRRKLKAITNQSSVEYVRNYRLDKASDMLKKGGKTVSEIAYDVGFESVPYFSKMFQERFGKTATEWKQ
ncbi:MAG: Phospho-acceptor protein, partial [Bacteroidota bacterium]|nr:Phospho-acceptor protein [Bacteroidota bacterium]